ncbi:hypothetical protein IMCC3088_648 [Aequoribacter fuscus]|jgi:hypothetical protein|uniref:Uncharacterized protein n=1 Tax=Aequoribacter fuscus TaxID=2518989 RepID=F3L611_9GAMM|nr:hypothetical protein IMCC3088_648 [Aequoribacter fuscus]
MHELMKICEFYIESQSWRVIPAPIGGAPLEKSVLDDVAVLMV